MNFFSYFSLTIVLYYCNCKTIFLGSNPTSFQDGSTSNPFSSLINALNELKSFPKNEEIDIIIKDKNFNNVLNENDIELKRLFLRIKY